MTGNQRRGLELPDASGSIAIVHPVVARISADYMEAACYALIRGVRANFPCFCCLVPHSCQADLKQTFAKPWPKRNAESMRTVVENASRSTTSAEREDILKNAGLANVGEHTWVITSHHFKCDYLFTIYMFL